MDIDKITYFFAAAENENFTFAAGKCGIAQTTMSKYITNLESELSCKLFIREAKRCKLTNEGKIFYDEMRKIHSSYNTLKQNLARASKSVLYIGIEGEIHTVPELIKFQETYPEIDFNVTFGSREELISLLFHDKLDALLLVNYAGASLYESNDFDIIELSFGFEKLICSKAAYEKYGSIEKVIQALPLVTKTDDTIYHDASKEELEKLFGVSFKSIILSDSVYKQQMLINMSQGIAIIPQFEIVTHDNIVEFPLTNNLSTQRLLVTERTKKKKDLELLKEYCKEATT